MRKLIVASLLITASALVMAKLSAPSDEAKAKAAEAAAKAAWSGKVDAYLSCKSQDRVAAHYYKTAKAANKEVRPPQTMPPCADPGVFSYTPAEVVKPLEAAGAHSPAPTATSPPSSKTPAAAIAPAKNP
jgi:type II secretory pathway pseudopilin PulG